MKRPAVSVIEEIDAEVTTRKPAKAELTNTPDKPKREYKGIHRTTVYIPQETHELIRRVAFDHRLKEHDIIMEGIALILTQKYGMDVTHNK